MIKHGMMPRRRLLAGAAGAAALLLAAGCGGDDQAGGEHGGSSTSAHSSSAPTTSAPASAEFNDTDVAFAQNMIAHHRQAVEMADLAASRAGDAEIKKLATQIKAAQEPEIQTLTGWLTAWGKPIEPAGGHGSGHEMPGMMSESEMAKLKSAKGTKFDRLFAELMIAHHNGAVEMAREEQSKGGNTEAKALAATIERTQGEEVTQLKKIADRL
jgi:uncharacterized protein (DUF305 family)